MRRTPLSCLWIGEGGREEGGKKGGREGGREGVEA